MCYDRPVQILPPAIRKKALPHDELREALRRVGSSSSE